MTMSGIWRRRLTMREEGASSAEIADAEGVTLSAIEAGFHILRLKGYHVPAAFNGMAIKLTPEARKRIWALSEEFGKTPTQVVNEIIQGAVVDVPDIARNLLDPEA